MSTYPTPVSAIDVRVGSASVLAIEGVDGGAWLSGKPSQQQLFCAVEMRSGGCDAYDISPFDGCVAITDDGGCSYETKAANAAAAGGALCTSSCVAVHAAAGAAGILVVAVDSVLSVMGCKTCAKLPLFGWMISRSDGDRLRRVLDADSSARIMCLFPTTAAAAAAEAHHVRYTSANRPPSALAIDSSGCARQVSHNDTPNCLQLPPQSPH
jgi:hypothetical protein